MRRRHCLRGVAAIERGVVEIAADEARAEAEIACRLDEHHREVAAGAALLFESLPRRLGARLVPLGIDDVRLQCDIHSREQVECAHRPRGDEASALVMLSVAGAARKSTSATELPNTSCIQRTLPGGDSASSA